MRSNTPPVHRGLWLPVLPCQLRSRARMNSALRDSHLHNNRSLCDLRQCGSRGGQVRISRCVTAAVSLRQWPPGGHHLQIFARVLGQQSWVTLHGVKKVKCCVQHATAGTSALAPRFAAGIGQAIAVQMLVAGSKHSTSFRTATPLNPPNTYKRPPTAQLA